MKKFFVFSLLIIVTIFVSSCGQTAAIADVSAPVSKKSFEQKTVDVSPTEFVVDELKVEKDDTEGAEEEKGSIKAQFTIAFKADITGDRIDHIGIKNSDYNDGMKIDGGKTVKAWYSKLKKVKKEDILITYQLKSDSSYQPVKVKIKERLVPVKNSEVKKEEPEIVLWRVWNEY